MGKQFGWTALDTVNSEVVALQAVIDTLKNTDVATLSTKVDAVMTDNKYSPLSKSVAVTLNTSTFTEVLNITGAGYLSQIMAFSSGAYIKITVDGVDKIINKHYLSMASADQLSYGGGFGLPDLTTNGIITASATLAANYPDITSNPYSIILAKPIYFNTSLVISSKGSSAGSVSFRYNGGIK